MAINLAMQGIHPHQVSWPRRPCDQRHWLVVHGRTDEAAIVGQIEAPAPRRPTIPLRRLRLHARYDAVDPATVGRVLFRRYPRRRRKLGLSDRRRMFPAGDAGAGHCLLPCGRHWRDRPRAVRRTDRHRAQSGRRRCCLPRCYPATTFSPATPPTISAMQASRARLASSPRARMPYRATPPAPIPTQTA